MHHSLQSSPLDMVDFEVMHIYALGQFLYSVKYMQSLAYVLTSWLCVYRPVVLQIFWS